MDRHYRLDKLRVENIIQNVNIELKRKMADEDVHMHIIAINFW